MTVGERMLQRR